MACESALGPLDEHILQMQMQSVLLLEDLRIARAYFTTGILQHYAAYKSMQSFQQEWSFKDDLGNQDIE